MLHVVAGGTGGSLPGVTPGGSPWDTGAGTITVTGGPGVEIPQTADSPAGALAMPQPVNLGSFTPTRVPGTSEADLAVGVPLSFLFEPVKNLLDPKFKPSALIQLQAQEPPPGWPDPHASVSCTDSRIWSIGDAAEASRGEGVPIIYHEDYGPLVARLHIGTAAANYSERQQRLIEQLRSAVYAAATAKYRLDTDMPSLEQGVAGADAEISSLQAKVPPLVASLDETRSFFAQIQTAEDNLPSSVRAELQAQDSLEQTVQQLEDRVVQAEQAGQSEQVATLKADLSTQRERLAIIDKSLAGRDGGVDSVIGRWVAKLRSIQSQVYALEQAQAQAVLVRHQANQALQQAIDQRAALDRELDADGEQLLNADFQVTAVSVTANGSPVFKAKLLGNELALEAIDAEIADATPVLADLTAEYRATNQHVQAMQRAASAALGDTATTILQNMWAEATITTVDYGYDVLKGFAKGGPLGALGAAAKKGWEKYGTVYESLVIGKNALFGPAGSTKQSVDIPEFDHQFVATLQDDITREVDKIYGTNAKGLPSLVSGRPFKEVVSKQVSGLVNKGLVALYQKFYKDLPILRRVAGSAPVTTGFGKLLAKAKDFLKWSKNNDAALKYMTGQTAQKGVKAYGFNGGTDIAASFARDVAKAGAKVYLNSRERAAWENYFKLEAAALLYNTRRIMMYNTYWPFVDYYEQLLAEKAQLLASYNPSMQSPIELDRSFAQGTPLVVTLTVVRPDGATAPLDLAVLVASRPATETSRYVYTIGSGSLHEGPKGLGLLIEAR